MLISSIQYEQEKICIVKRRKDLTVLTSLSFYNFPRTWARGVGYLFVNYLGLISTIVFVWVCRWGWGMVKDGNAWRGQHEWRNDLNQNQFWDRSCLNRNQGILPYSTNFAWERESPKWKSENQSWDNFVTQFSVTIQIYAKMKSILLIFYHGPYQYRGQGAATYYRLLHHQLSV